MPISDKDIKMLWGRAAGKCSNPVCETDLICELENNDYYIIGEMAHIIAQSPLGPRGDLIQDKDTYKNLILLCPTCHKMIDKAPQKFSTDKLHGWKKQHEAKIQKIDANLKLDTIDDLKYTIKNILTENQFFLKRLGPDSDAARDNPASNLYKIWELRKIDTLIPNNHRIINIIEANLNLLNHTQLNALYDFKVHATSFEENQYERLDNYPRFPQSFLEEFFND
ncbi:HNH endonuclease [Legionella longbeachae]|uniref:HNH endonuclease n=1 Tax=Legionella longbeachae TaxID=450 RepID=UPI000F73844C|nr:HNH endonuclease [Legionella longbeachae]ARM34000.2 HNH endonuclease [Legionella longbeachae]